MSTTPSPTDAQLDRLCELEELYGEALAEMAFADRMADEAGKVTPLSNALWLEANTRIQEMWAELVELRIAVVGDPEGAWKL